jgi:hypothetical protein
VYSQAPGLAEAARWLCACGLWLVLRTCRFAVSSRRRSAGTLSPDLITTMSPDDNKQQRDVFVSNAAPVMQQMYHIRFACPLRSTSSLSGDATGGRAATRPARAATGHWRWCTPGTSVAASTVLR